MIPGALVLTWPVGPLVAASAGALFWFGMFTINGTGLAAAAVKR